MMQKVNGLTIEVVFSDGHTEQVGHTDEWMAFLSATHDQKTNYWATITAEMYDVALQEIDDIKLPIAGRVKKLLTVAKENKIESMVFM
jgi:hypothetical protein